MRNAGSVRTSLVMGEGSESHFVFPGYSWVFMGVVTDPDTELTHSSSSTLLSILDTDVQPCYIRNTLQ